MRSIRAVAFILNLRPGIEILEGSHTFRFVSLGRRVCEVVCPFSRGRAQQTRLLLRLLWCER